MFSVLFVSSLFGRSNLERETPTGLVSTLEMGHVSTGIRDKIGKN